MGADCFVAIYGVRFDLGDADTLEAFRPPWMNKTRAAGLTLWSGRLTDGAPHYLVVGRLVGKFGIEGHQSQVALSDPAFADLSRSTRERLTKAQVPGEPALHLLFEAQD